MKYFITLILFVSFQSFAQQSIYSGYIFPDTIPSEYIFNVKQEYAKASDLKIPDVNQKNIERYAEAVSYGKQELFTSGYVYIQWKELETYLNNVLNLVLPEELKTNKAIHIYPTRDAGSNAFTIHDGSIFLNIGLIANVENEAALAIIIGHEISHYLNDDVKNGYLRSLKIYTRYNRNKNYALKLNEAKFDRSIESKADSLGFILAENAGYDISYGISNYLTFKEIEQFEKYKKKARKLVNVPNSQSSKSDSSEEKTLNDLLADHPDLNDRISYLKNFMNSPERKTGKQTFQISQSIFTELQKKAKLESINILLAENNFRECLKQSFINYLLDPDNENYTYYLLESLRRIIYTDNKIKQKEFLSDQIKKNKKGEGILHSLKLLIPDYQKFRRIKDNALLDTNKIAFETYEEAFRYFEEIAKTKKIAESYLTLALYYNETDSLKTKYLKEYIGSPGIKYKEYASCLLANNLEGSLNNNKRELILFDNITFLEDHFYGYHNRLILAEQKSPKYLAEMQNMFKKQFPEKEIIEIEKFNYTDLKTKMDFRNVINSSIYSSDDNDDSKESSEDVVYFNQSEKNNNSDKFNLFLLNPDFWSVFKENELKSINYMKVTAFDDKTKVLKLLNFINPMFWLTIVARYYVALYSGSSRYEHEVLYYSYDINSKQSKFYSEKIHYKMTKAYFLNSVYYAIKTNEK